MHGSDRPPKRQRTGSPSAEQRALVHANAAGLPAPSALAVAEPSRTFNARPHTDLESDGVPQASSQSVLRQPPPQSVGASTADRALVLVPVRPADVLKPRQILSAIGRCRQLIEGDGDCSIAAVVHQIIVGRLFGRFPSVSSGGHIPDELTTWTVRKLHLTLIRNEARQPKPDDARNFALAGTARQWRNNNLMFDLHQRLANAFRLNIVLVDTSSRSRKALPRQPPYSLMRHSGSAEVPHDTSSYWTAAELRAAVGEPGAIYIEHIGGHFHSLVATEEAAASRVSTSAYDFGAVSQQEQAEMAAAAVVSQQWVEEIHAAALMQQEASRVRKESRREPAKEATSAVAGTAVHVALMRDSSRKRQLSPPRIAISVRSIRSRQHAQVLAAIAPPPLPLVPAVTEAKPKPGGGYCDCTVCLKLAKQLNKGDKHRGLQQKRNTRNKHRSNDKQRARGMPIIYEVRDGQVIDEPSMENGCWGTSLLRRCEADRRSLWRYRCARLMSRIRPRSFLSFCDR
jgi:hypothetical protein